MTSQVEQVNVHASSVSPMSRMALFSHPLLRVKFGHEGSSRGILVLPEFLRHVAPNVERLLLILPPPDIAPADMLEGHRRSARLLALEHVGFVLGPANVHDGLVILGRQVRNLAFAYVEEDVPDVPGMGVPDGDGGSAAGNLGGRQKYPVVYGKLFSEKGVGHHARNVRLQRLFVKLPYCKDTLIEAICRNYGPLETGNHPPTLHGSRSEGRAVEKPCQAKSHHGES